MMGDTGDKRCTGEPSQRPVLDFYWSPLPSLVAEQDQMTALKGSNTQARFVCRGICWLDQVLKFVKSYR